MSKSPIPPTDPRAGETARQKLSFTIALLLVSGSAILALVMLRRFPLPIRVFILTGDVIVIAALWMVMRQKFSGK
ncbi:MAG: hypothetical protein JWM32_474 [Verrucomicrobia bacterium]|nr:hypothetical protein [Verrucomicrobiota bacterium]